MSTDINSKIRNYQGRNSFILKMKDVLNRWNNLTAKQIEVVEKSFKSESNMINNEELPEDLKRIVNYDGKNTFVVQIKDKLVKHGTLTDRQKLAAISIIQKEKERNRIVTVKVPTPGESILIGRKIGNSIREKYGLEFNPTIIDITKIISISPKAVLFSGKMTVKRGKVCVCCGRTLTDEFSMLTNMGKTCAGHMKVEYITDASQADDFRERYLKRVEEIGEFTFWIPKSQIKKWDGFRQIVLEMV